MVWGVQHIFKMGGLALEGLTQVLKGWDGLWEVLDFEV